MAHLRIGNSILLYSTFSLMEPEPHDTEWPFIFPSSFLAQLHEHGLL